MTYVPGYEYDLFISYPREANVDAWVTKFYTHLKEKLDTLLRGISIYFDDNNYKAYNHRKRMLDAAGRSALFIPILCPAYLYEDKFTRLELKEFCSNCKDVDCIVIVEIYPVTEGRPPELHGPNRNQFYNENRVSLKPGTAKYENTIMRIAEDIRDQLKALCQKYRKTVLLAKTTPDLDAYSKVVGEDLKRCGFTVLPELEYPVDRKDFEEKFRADLAKADLFVQLLGQYGSVESASNNAEATFTQFQYYEANNVGVPVLQWVSPGVELSKVSDDSYKRLLNGPHVKVTSLKDFKDTIKRGLKTLSELMTDPIAEDRQSGIYIAADPSDTEYARTLKHKLIDLGVKDYEILDESEKLEHLKHIIETASAVVLVQGNAEAKFINSWLSIYKRLRSGCKTHPKLEAIMYAPPPREDKNDPPDVGFDGLDRFLPPEAFPQKDFEEMLRRRLA